MEYIAMAVATAIILGALGWVGNKSSDNNDKLTRMEVTLPFLQTTIVKLELALSNLVTRPELDGRLAEIKASQAAIQLDILKLQMRVGIAPQIGDPGI